jgi:hypothetical protein
MVSTKKEHEHEHDRGSEVAASGVRGLRAERETTPAPASVEDEWVTNVPSARPTSVPDYDVAAVAFETSLRHHALPSLPLDVAVPTRTYVAPPAELDLRACFLLLHVDGRSSVRDIAELTALPVEEVLGGMLDLSTRGLVEIDGTQLARDVPVSGGRRR